MVQLMERLSQKLVHRVQENINVSAILQGIDLTVDLNFMSKTRKLLEDCYIAYIEVR